MKFQVIDTQYKNLVLNIKNYFNQATSCVHKARNEIKVVSHNENSYVVKSFKIPNFINKIIYTFFRDSKAKKSYDNSLKIDTFTPKAIGYIEFKKYGLLHESYFISEYFEYDFTIREPLLDSNFENRKIILEEFARFSYDMHERNIFHNDYSPGNILIKKDGSSYIFKVVDVNRMNFFTLLSKDRARNFAQLWASDNDLKIITETYLQYYNTKEDFVQEALEFSHKHKKKKNLKKRLKANL